MMKVEILNGRRRNGFTLVEMITVIALIALLGTGAILGYKQASLNANFQKVVRDLNAIDLAKSTWLQFHANDTWPSSESDRWTALVPYLKQMAVGVKLGDSDFYTYPGYSPVNYGYHIGNLTEAASATYNVTGKVVIRPL